MGFAGRIRTSPGPAGPRARKQRWPGTAAGPAFGVPARPPRVKAGRAVSRRAEQVKGRVREETARPQGRSSPKRTLLLHFPPILRVGPSQAPSRSSSITVGLSGSPKTLSAVYPPVVGVDTDKCGGEEVEQGPGLLVGGPLRVQEVPTRFRGSHEVRRGIPFVGAQRVEDPERRLIVPCLHLPHSLPEEGFRLLG